MNARIVGTWNAALASPGGQLPFGLEIADDGRGVRATIRNGPERLTVDRVQLSADQLTLFLDVYDAHITARVAVDNQNLIDGEWSKTAASGATSRLPFAATRGIERRFPEPGPGVARATREGAAAVPVVGGAWQVTFTDDDGPWPARGELTQDGDRVQGTFLTATGDFRYLDGEYRDGLLRLSAFDGAHAFLFHARAQADGSLAGDFWSRDTYHATWIATRATGEGDLPDPFAEVTVTSADGRVGFAFPDLDGTTVSLADPRFAGKVVLVEIFGTWCPNCADQAPLMASWHRTYRDRGLDMIGLAYEFSGEPARDRRVLRVYRDHHGIEFPLLLAGISDKAEAAKTLPDLSSIKSYPTTLFVARDGTVRHIYSGFAGPATGEHHTRLVHEFERRIEALLAEPPPP